MMLTSLPLISELVVDMSCSRPPSLLGVCWRPTWQGRGLQPECKNAPVNYAIRSSGPVTALTAAGVRYGVGPDLICQPGPGRKPG
jgi:hypothetical protein